jgi:hypothetical protein
MLRGQAANTLSKESNCQSTDKPVRQARGKLIRAYVNRIISSVFFKQIETLAKELDPYEYLISHASTKPFYYISASRDHIKGYQFRAATILKIPTILKQSTIWTLRSIYLSLSWASSLPWHKLFLSKSSLLFKRNDLEGYYSWPSNRLRPIYIGPNENKPNSTFGSISPNTPSLREGGWL